MQKIHFLELEESWTFTYVCISWWKVLKALSLEILYLMKCPFKKVCKQNLKSLHFQQSYVETCLKAIDPESVSKQKRNSDDNLDKRTSDVMKMWKIVQCRPAAKIYESFEIILKLIMLQQKQSLIGDRWCGNFQKSPQKQFLRAVFGFLGGSIRLTVWFTSFARISSSTSRIPKKKCLLGSSFFLLKMIDLKTKIFLVFMDLLPQYTFVCLNLECKGLGFKRYLHPEAIDGNMKNKVFFIIA